MKAISLWQPWATLVALGEKQIETRHWEPPAALIGQRIAIHAAKRWTDAERILSRQKPFRTVLRDAALMGDERGENGLPRMFYRLVQIAWYDHTGQLSPAEARQLAQQLHEAAAVAEQDAALFAFAREGWATEEDAAAILKAFRIYKDTGTFPREKPE